MTTKEAPMAYGAPRRLSILVDGAGHSTGIAGTADACDMALGDRIANGQAMPGERRVRLPRTFLSRGYRLSYGCRLVKEA